MKVLLLLLFLFIVLLIIIIIIYHHHHRLLLLFLTRHKEQRLGSSPRLVSLLIWAPQQSLRRLRVGNWPAVWYFLMQSSARTACLYEELSGQS